ncbi:MAG: hypothetical protein WA738_06725 [Candidatus Angelobacter sp.]
MTNLLRAPSKAMAPRLKEKTLLTRNSWKHILTLALITFLTAASAFAEPGRQIANQQMFRPRGMVRATVHLPGGGEITDYWVSDGASGFCRIDQQPDPNNPGLTRGILNLSTCYLPGVFEPMDYQAETRGVNGSNGYVFVGGIKEVTRIEFKQSPTEPGRTVINTDPGKQISIYSVTSVFANGAPAIGPRFVQSVRMGPDGKLYICFQGSGDIWRIRNPLSPSFTPLGNAVERVGTSDNGKTLLSMGWIGHDLWMQQAGFLNRIQNADKCNYGPNCVAILEFGKLQTQEGMATDQYISSSLTGRWLYWGNGNRVVRYDTLSADIMQQWNQSGFVNGSVIPQQYTLIMGLNFVQPQHPTPGDPKQDLFTLADGSQVADMTVTMDKIIEAPPPAVAGTLPKTGVTYLLKSHSTMVPEPCNSTPPNPPPCVNSQIGNDNPPNPSPVTVAARRAILLVSGVTHPRGLLFLQTNWWVSDEDNGFCRIDQNPVTGAATFLNFCFKPSPGFIPGQPAADKADNLGRQNVYIPDASGSAKGVVRAVFTPGVGGGTLSESGLLNSGPGTAEAVALPQGPFNDGAIYIGYTDNGKINKIQQPATAPTAPIAVGGLSRGIGVLSLAFESNDLYIAELGPPANTAGQLITGGQITVLQAASPDLHRGSAREVTKPISRLQSPTLNTTPQLFVNPGAILVGPAIDRPACLPPIGVATSLRVAADPTTTPSLYFGSFGVNEADAATSPAQLPEVDQFDSVCTTEIPWAVEGSLDALRSLNVPLSPITALGITSYSDPTAQLAIGDDPNTIAELATLQKSKITAPSTGPLHGQGHVYIVP